MKTKAIKPSLSSPKGPRRNVESEDLMAFLVSATLVRTPHVVGACMGCSEEITGTTTNRLADRPFCQGPIKHEAPSGENAFMRVNDNLKGMLGNSRARAGSGCFHPW